MLIDITTKITPKMVEDAQGNEKKALVGHLGTHFDVMNKEFPLDYVERKGIVFDVSSVQDREIDSADIDMSAINQKMFVAFYTGFIEDEGYGSQTYFKEHPQLAHELIEELVQKEVSIIGIDFAGVRRGREHTPKDQYLADRGIFVIENLCNLANILQGEKQATFTANTYPVNYTDMTGLPCRVVAKL
ncbi:cyclase family protein [Clostridium aminobutyricum]|uniref:Cyclase family protein n=1 Tax=Clostridium aminobutyricum TaxID=33953 RepID=A0A939IHS6_CLOAM|nr:cyclase family protein [Clostridium aminobutyricum]MBN7772346.1 cyclase family protein [Clostridium aminobutyricum]